MFQVEGNNGIPVVSFEPNFYPEEMQSHNLIHLSELPLVWKINVAYQSILYHLLVVVIVEGLKALVVEEEI